MASIPTQEEILAATRKSQEAMIAALKSWLETVRTATPKLTAMYAPLTDKLPKLPPVSLPFADKLPTPEEAVASAYHTAEQLLANQRKFTEDLLKAMTPLIPSRGESSAEAPSRTAWQDAVTASEPKTVASAVPAAAPARPQAKSTPTRPQAKTTPARPQAKSTPARPQAKTTPARPAPRTAAATPTAADSASKSAPAASARKSATASSAPKSASTATAAGQAKAGPAASTTIAAGQAKAGPASKDADAS